MGINVKNSYVIYYCLIFAHTTYFPFCDRQRLHCVMREPVVSLLEQCVTWLQVGIHRYGMGCASSLHTSYSFGNR